MKKILCLMFLLCIQTFSLNAEILVDKTGARYLTLGSTKEEVLEVIGTPSKISGSIWYYGPWSWIEFDQSNKILQYDGADNLRITLSKTTNKVDDCFLECLRNPPCTNVASNTVSSKKYKTVSYPSYSKGYGEISATTGRAKTVHVKGYTRKDGTYVQPHYRSPARR